MAIVAPYSKFKKTNLKIYIVFLIALALWCAYDGYINKSWIEEHTNEDGTPMTYLTFNRNAPYVLGAGAVILGIFLGMVSGKKLTADENELVISEKEKIPYSAIQQINKTHFESKGYFIVGYKTNDDKDAEITISSKKYDNLGAVLDELVSKIS